MNSTNYTHGKIAGIIQLVIGLIPSLALHSMWPILAGGAIAMSWFISREHAQQQTDNKILTGVPIAEQNIWDGFKGWDRDRQDDVLFPLYVVTVIDVSTFIGLYHQWLLSFLR